MIFLVGLIIGSFLNVLIWRLNDPKAPKFWQGRSLCPHCKHQIAWFDNIPLLSFILLRGRCRHCHRKISWQYPAVELLTGTYFALTGLHPVLWLIGAAFIVIFFSDLIYGLIPDEMIVLLILLSFFNFNLLTGLVSGLAFLIIYLITKHKGIGFGDVKLALVMGLLLGWPKTAVAFWVAFIMGGLAAVILLVLRKTKLSATIPLGPFLVLGTVVAALWSENLVTLLSSF